MIILSYILLYESLTILYIIGVGYIIIIHHFMPSECIISINPTEDIHVSYF